MSGGEPASRERVETSRRDATALRERRCRVCGRTFPAERLLALHRGVRHPDALTDDEREAYRAAYADEESALRSFRLRALGVLAVLYFGFLLLFAVFAS